MSVLRLRPWTVKKASALRFNAQVHRRLPKVQGAMWCVSVRADGGEVVGVALVGWPAQEWTNKECDTLAVLRVAVKPGLPKVRHHASGACSMLYGACSRAARAMGCDNLVTYTHEDEHGVSLRAAGWIEDCLTEGGEYDRPSRQRELQIDPNPKRRWWAPWSKRAPNAGTPRAVPAGSAAPT